MDNWCKRRKGTSLMPIFEVHFKPDPEVLRRLGRIEDKVDLVLNQQETIMSTLDDLTAILNTIDGQVTKVKTDGDTLLAKLTAIPPGGLTPAQQTAIDDAVTHAVGIATSSSIAVC